MQYIVALMDYVNQNESTSNSTVATQETIDKLERISTEFNNGWKTHINNMNTSILQAFPNFQNGARILHAALTQFLLYYRRFLALWEKRVGKKSKVQPVGIQSLMVEIKKFKSNFQ